jgi:AcrR family transcriptional regulator
MIDAIAELSAEQGYEATKIADIVRCAGVARKTLYDNFEGKEDLFLAAFDVTVTEARAAVEEACEATGGGWQQRIESGLAAFLRFVGERPAAARMCMVEALSATPTASARYDAAMREFVALLKENAPGGSDLPELLPELSEFILSPYHGVAEEATGTARRK